MLLTILEGGLEAFSTIETIWDDIDYVLGLTDEKPKQKQPDPQLQEINERLKSIDARLQKINNSLKDIFNLLSFEETRALTKKYEDSITNNYLSMLSFYDLHPQPALDSWVQHVLDTDLGMEISFERISQYVDDQSFIQKYVDHFIGNSRATTSMQAITNIQYAYFIGFEYKALLTYFNCVSYYKKPDPQEILQLKQVAGKWLEKIKSQAHTSNVFFQNNYEQTCFFPKLDENSNTAFWGHMGLPSSTDEKKEKNGTIVTGMNWGNDSPDQFGYIQLTRSTIVQSEVPDPDFPDEIKYLAGQLIDSHHSPRENTQITVPEQENYLPVLAYIEPLMADPGYVIVGAGIENINLKICIVACPKIQVQKLTIIKEEGKTRYELDESDEAKWIHVKHEDSSDDKNLLKNTHFMTEGADAYTRTMLYNSAETPTPELPLIGVQLQVTSQERSHPDKSEYEDDKWYIKVIPMNNLDAEPYGNVVPQSELFATETKVEPPKKGSPKMIIASGILIAIFGLLIRWFSGLDTIGLALMAIGLISGLFGIFSMKSIN